MVLNDVFDVAVENLKLNESTFRKHTNEKNIGLKPT